MAKNGIVKFKVDNVLEEIFVKSNVYNIFMADGVTTLSKFLTDLTAVIDGKDDSTTVDTKVSNAIKNLVGTAPEELDTLKEIADYLSTHADEYGALMNKVNAKVDKVEGKGLSTNDFTTEEKTKLAGIAANANNYVLPKASSTSLGGVKTGFTNNGKNYKLQVDSNGNGYVNVPWSDTTYSAATTSKAGLMSASDKTNLDQVVTDVNALEQRGRIFISASEPSGLASNDLWIHISDTTA